MAARVAAWKKMPIPPVLSPISELLVSADGSFWVQIQDTTNPAKTEAARSWRRDRFPANASVWHLYDASGMFAGAVQLPARFRPEAVSGKTVIGVWADDNDVEFVIRYEARPSGQPRTTLRDTGIGAFSHGQRGAASVS
jgi:hypothetical protein